VPGQLIDRVAVVTGANRGIGQAIALAMSAEGARVVATARDIATLSDTLALIDEGAGGALALACDVTDEASMDTMSRQAQEWFGHVDVVVANAGIAGPTRLMHELELGEWRECVSIDLDGVFLSFRRFIPGMIARRSGSLIAVSSMTGKRPLLGRSPYAAAKMGVIGLMRTLATELGPHGIRANTVCPGAVRGPRLVDVIRDQAQARGVDEETSGRIFTDASALGRFVEPEEVADACVFLAGNRSSSVTGQDLNVAAGAIMY
jgi:NAD(P)-dependent dehydrogenase (short-subunit alcohol dehydrogenase family)